MSHAEQRRQLEQAKAELHSMARTGLLSEEQLQVCHAHPCTVWFIAED